MHKYPLPICYSINYFSYKKNPETLIQQAYFHLLQKHPGKVPVLLGLIRSAWSRFPQFFSRILQCPILPARFCITHLLQCSLGSLWPWTVFYFTKMSCAMLFLSISSCDQPIFSSNVPHLYLFPIRRFFIFFIIV